MADQPDQWPGVTLTVTRVLSCGCSYTRQHVRSGATPSPGWVDDIARTARTFAWIMRILPLAHKCPKEKV